VDQAQSKSSLGHEANLHAARCAHKKHFGVMAVHQFVGYRKRWDNMTACAATGYKNTQLSQDIAFHKEVRREIKQSGNVQQFLDPGRPLWEAREWSKGKPKRSFRLRSRSHDS
jgi:hypothetical protein